MKRLCKVALLVGALLLGSVLAYMTTNWLEKLNHPSNPTTSREPETSCDCRLRANLEVGLPTLAPPRDATELPAFPQFTQQTRTVYINVETDRPGLEIEWEDD